jgi:integrase
VVRFLASGLDPIPYLAQRRSEISARSVYNEAVALKSWLRWCGEHEQAAAIRFPFPPLAPQPPFSDDDLRCLFDHATVRERNLCLLLLTTGMRARELLTAQPMGDIARVMGKGGREGFVALPFPIDDGVVPHSYQTLWRVLHELGLRAGVHCTPRRFRTSHAHLLLRTNDLQTVQLALRHARITTTAIYTRWGAESRALEAQRRLAERLIGAL